MDSTLRRTTTRGSLFSEAPAAVRILRRNENTVGKITGVIYWYYFRLWFPYISPLFLIIMYIIPLTTMNTLPGYLLCGSLLSALSCGLAILSYIQILPWRKHPSPLIILRTLVHFIFSIILMINAFEKKNDEHSSSCKILSFLTQFTFFTGESWLVTIGVDLILSLSNPFTSYKGNINKYHIVVWSFGLMNALSLAENSSCQGTFANHICWIHVDNPLSTCIWGFYLSWVLVFYAFCIGSICFATYRISRGLERTYRTRRACVQDTFTVVITYIAYSVLVCVLYIVVIAHENAVSHDSAQFDSNFARHMKNVIAYLLALRGFVDGALWFSMRDFTSMSNSKALAGVGNKPSFRWMEWTSPLVREKEPSRATITTSASDGRSTKVNFQEDVPSVLVEEDFGVDIDLSPQLNMALREEVVHFTTRGIMRSVELAAVPISETQRSFDIDQRHIFTDYQPDIFRALRDINDIPEEWYLTQISQPAKERLTEGGSGAFMFFCGSGEFVVKTVSSDEADVLMDILDQYYKHLADNPSSLLVRFLGLHSLKMYNQTFRFVVMRNIFPPHATINQRYDIKGSWVSRNGGVVPPGKKIFCRHCGELFVSGSQTPCPDIVGVHEPNFVLKDNDFTSKIRLRPEDAYSTIDILNKDSDALCAMGITDYSLLVGVRNLQYEVDPERVISRRRNSVVFSRDSVLSQGPMYSSRQSMGTPVVDSVVDEPSTTPLPFPHGQRGITKSSSNVDPVSASCNDILETPVKMSTRESFESEKTVCNSTVSRRRRQTLQHEPSRIYTPADCGQTDSTYRLPQDSISNGSKFRTETKNDTDGRLSDIHSLDSGTNLMEIYEEEIAGGYLARSVIAPGVYYMGIIDILQKWTLEKRLERFFKVNFLMKSANGISCMPPEPYKIRFQHKVSQIIEHSIFIREITGSWKGKREISEPTPLIET